MKNILVYADWHELPHTMLMGTMRADTIKGEEILSFEYTTDWLNSEYAIKLDPELGLFEGVQFPGSQKKDKNFGLFLDSSPDRWGKTLIERRELLLAEEEERSTQNLFPSDYLLRLADETRLGAIRFKLSPEGEYLNNDPLNKTPPIAHIRTLEQASLSLEDEKFFDRADAKQMLEILLTPGSSLGGARPKANVRETDGSLWIAKFPSKRDVVDKGAWEYLCYELARACEIRMAPSRCKAYTNRQHTFLTQRFDRTDGEKRIHFASAMTLLGYSDGHNHQDGGAYLELVMDILEQNGAAPEQDIRELWMRIVFSVLIANTDDHLRNHGFLLTPQGWRLSPAYDLNPNPQGRGLSLNISEDDNRLSLDLCREVAEYYRWKKDEAEGYIQQCINHISTWPIIAQRLGISAAEQRVMRPAFDRHLQS